MGNKNEKKKEFYQSLQSTSLKLWFRIWSVIQCELNVLPVSMRLSLFSDIKHELMFVHTQHRWWATNESNLFSCRWTYFSLLHSLFLSFSASHVAQCFSRPFRSLCPYESHMFQWNPENVILLCLCRSFRIFLQLTKQKNSRVVCNFTLLLN